MIYCIVGFRGSRFGCPTYESDPSSIIQPSAFFSVANFQKTLTLGYHNLTHLNPAKIPHPQHLPHPVIPQHGPAPIGNDGQSTGVEIPAGGVSGDIPSGGGATPSSRLHPCPDPILITPRQGWTILKRKKKKI